MTTLRISPYLVAAALVAGGPARASAAGGDRLVIGGAGVELGVAPIGPPSGVVRADPPALAAPSPAPGSGDGMTSASTSLGRTSILSPPVLPNPDVPRLGGALSGLSPDVPERRRIGVAASEALGVHLSMMAWNRWGGAAPWADVSGDTVRRNLRSRWVLDDDEFWVNQFGHPYQGTWSYGAARSAGLGFWTSTAFPAAASALWEIAGETTRPALNDQITTTVAGVVLGEALWRFSEALRAEGGAVNEALAAVLSPMSAVNAHVLGRSAPRAAPSTRWELQLGGLAGDAPRAVGAGNTALPRAFAGVDFTWGVPGDPELVLEEPFDHFVLQASYGAAADPVAVVRGRGLLLGATFEPGEDVRGLWGLFLSFDFDTTGPYRVSTSAVGVGLSGRAGLGGGLALEATAVASAVLMGAAGDIPPAPGGAGRDYRFGPGEQAVAELKLRADPRISSGFTLRQYLVAGDGPGGGTELLVEASAGVLFRIAGSHAVGAEATRHLRRGHDATGGPVGNDGTALRVYYALASGG